MKFTAISFSRSIASKPAALSPCPQSASSLRKGRNGWNRRANVGEQKGRMNPTVPKNSFRFFAERSSGRSRTALTFSGSGHRPSGPNLVPSNLRIC